MIVSVTESVLCIIFVKSLPVTVLMTVDAALPVSVFVTEAGTWVRR